MGDGVGFVPDLFPTGPRPPARVVGLRSSHIHTNLLIMGPIFISTPHPPYIFPARHRLFRTQEDPPSGDPLTLLMGRGMYFLSLGGHHSILSQWLDWGIGLSLARCPFFCYAAIP